MKFHVARMNHIGRFLPILIISCLAINSLLLGLPSTTNHILFLAISLMLLVDGFVPENYSRCFAEKVRPRAFHATGTCLALYFLIVQNPGLFFEGFNLEDNVRNMLSLQGFVLFIGACCVILNIKASHTLAITASFVIMSLKFGIIKMLLIFAPCLIAFLLISCLPQTFSLGEASICSLMITCVIIFGRLSPDNLSRIGLSWLSSTMLSLALISVIPKTRRYKTPIFAIFLSVSPILSTRQLSGFGLGFFSLINSKRLQIGLEWLSILAMTLAVTSLYLLGKQKSVNYPFLRRIYELELIRKFYHFICVLLFIPALMKDVAWLKLGMTIAANIFIVLEAFRNLARHSFLGDSFTRRMEIFRNQHDPGQAILSHLWLLIGCALPVFLTKDTNRPLDKLQAASGILSLGFLDSFAAIVGKIFAGRRWPNSNRTMIGSLAGFVAFLAAQWIFLLYWYPYHAIPFGSLLVRSGLCTAWEAFGDQNDNLTLPLVAFLSHRL